MKHLKLGKTGLEVSEFGFGGIPIQRLSREDGVGLVRYAFERGITFFDTAASYGASEERIGEGLDGVRDRVIVATKSNAAIECSAGAVRTARTAGTARTVPNRAKRRGAAHAPAVGRLKW